MTRPGSGLPGAALIAVGGELFRPERTDRNTPFLKRRLADLGIPVVFQAVVPDEDEVLAAALARALRRYRFVLACGGLGPTSDDRTRFAAAAALGVPLREDPGSLEAIRARFGSRGFPMPELNRVQARVPEGAEVLPNRAGTAPGVFARTPAGHCLILLPGPPSELRAMFETAVRPRLEEEPDRGGGLATEVLGVSGLPESVVQERIADLVPRRGAGAGFAILPSAGEIELRITAPVGHPDEPARTAGRIAARLGESVYTRTAGEGVEHAVGRLLASRRERVALAESLTGGMIGARITRVPGSSGWFDLGLTTYSNESKRRLLGVPESVLKARGAVSRETVEAMAAGARRQSGTAWGLAVTGIAGPDGGSVQKPVGLVWIAVSGPRSRAVRFVFPGDRALVRRLTASFALDLLRRALLEASPDPVPESPA